MDHRGMELNELMGEVKTELRNTGYSDLYIQGLSTVWGRLTDYMSRNGKTIFTAKNGMDFLEAEYGITVYKNLDSEKKRIVRERSICLWITCCTGSSFPELSRQYEGTDHNFKRYSKATSMIEELMA